LSRPQQIGAIGFDFGKTFSIPGYEITRLKKAFLIPLPEMNLWMK